MRGRRDPQATMLAFVDMEERVPKDHPIRSIKAVADEAWSVCRQSSIGCTRRWAERPSRRNDC